MFEENTMVTETLLPDTTMASVCSLELTRLVFARTTPLMPLAPPVK
jgi:hypothetical protein